MADKERIERCLADYRGAEEAYERASEISHQLFEAFTQAQQCLVAALEGKDGVRIGDTVVLAVPSPFSLPGHKTIQIREVTELKDD